MAVVFPAYVCGVMGARAPQSPWARFPSPASSSCRGETGFCCTAAAGAATFVASCLQVSVDLGGLSCLL